MRHSEQTEPGSAALAGQVATEFRQADRGSKGSWIPELEGLRGILALWVFVGHGLGMAGIALGDLPIWLRPLRSGTLAVDVFIVLSGFVIAGLVERERLPWFAFITRRWFRLFPAYAVCLLLGWLTLQHAESLGSAKGLGELSNQVVLRVGQTREHLVAHVIAHAFMLHGVLPNEVLPFSTGAFVDAAWSISLEWQFYLIAPFLVACLKVRPRAWVVASLVALMGSVANGRLYSYDFAGFLPLKLHYFCLGIASWFVYRSACGVKQPIAIGIAIGLFLFAVMRSEVVIPLALWCCVLGVVLARSDGGIVRRVLCWKPIAFFGTVSYGFYLCHQPVQVWLRAMMVGTESESSKGMALLWMLFVAGIVALVVAVTLHFVVERPGMRLGKQISARLARCSASYGNN